MLSDYEFLVSRLKYDPETGLFTRIKSVPGNKGKEGSIAGGVSVQGYVEINFRGGKKKAHRLAWLYMTGEWPEKDVDHINGDRSDNRWENLREADDSMNAQNQRRPNRRGTTGYLGASRFGGRFRAQIQVDGVVRHIGLYDTALEAHEAYVAKKRELHPGNTL